jgi:sec-independent protein translocase protein TatA
MFSAPGPTELIIILVIVLVLFGARKVPEIGASIGKGIREFKKNINDVNNQVRNSDAEPRTRISGGDPDVERRAAEEEEVRPEPRRLL